MLDLDFWQEIWQTISRNKMRSFMTAFGVFWGIFMLIVMVGCGIGLNNGMSKQFEAFSANSMYIFTGNTSMPYKGFKSGRSWDIRNKDIDILKSQFKDIRLISGVIFNNSNVNNVVRDDKYGSFNIIGYNSDYNKIDPQLIVHGRFINEIDVKEKRKVCVIGKKVYEELFLNGENPIGKLLKLNGIYYTVIGSTIPATSVYVGGNPQERVMVPLTTLQQSLNMGDIIHSIAITAYDNKPITTLEEDIKKSIKKIYQINPEDNQAIESFNVSNVFNAFNGLSLGISLLIWIVGLGTLLAGVVGVSNIMLVTVRERTQEIGIRRALGAKPFKIIFQIMSESLVLTSIAGILGIMAGVGFLVIIDLSIVLSQTEEAYFELPQIPFSIAILSLFIFMFFVMFAGLLLPYRVML